MGLQRLVLLIFLIFSVGCASTPGLLSQVQKGMDNSEVLELVGSPSRSYRKNSVDHWVYTYYVNDVKQDSLIRIKNSKVISKSSLRAGHSAATEEEFKEYTQGLKDKRESQKGFEELN